MAIAPVAACTNTLLRMWLAQELCAEYGIPTGAYGVFTDPGAAKAYVRERGAPIVVKADGLAAGKGVVVAQSVAQAEAAIDDILVARRFGEAGARADALPAQTAPLPVCAACGT